MEPEEPSTKVWPFSLPENRAKATKAARQGIWVCAYGAILPLVFAFAGDDPRFGLAGGIANAFLFAALGYGIYRMSRVAAFALLAIQVAYLLLLGGPNIIQLALTVLCINVIRGTISYHMLAKQPATA